MSDQTEHQAEHRYEFADTHLIDGNRHSHATVDFSMESDVYHGASALSSGGVRCMDRDGPEVFHDQHVARNKPDLEGKEWAQFGTILHTASLEPDKLATVGTLAPTSKSMEAAYAPFFAEVPKGKIKVTADMLGAAQKLAPHLLDVWRAAPLHREEVSIFWIEDFVSCKARLDTLAFAGAGPDAHIFVGDPKSMLNVHMWEVERRKRGYHLQAAHYVAGTLRQTHHIADASALTPTQLDDLITFVFLTVNKTGQHTVRLRYMTGEKLSEALIRRKQILLEISERLRSGDWTDHAERTPLEA